MFLFHEDRAHSGRSRWRGQTAPSDRLSRTSERVLVARMLYGGHAR